MYSNMPNPYKHYGSTAPYRANFNPDENYMKVLHIPGIALQSRELIDSQTYLQNQMSSFGGYFFKDGTTVDGGLISFYTTSYALKLDKTTDWIIGQTDDEVEKYIKNRIINKDYILGSSSSSSPVIKVTGYLKTKEEDKTDSNNKELKFDIKRTDTTITEWYLSFVVIKLPTTPQNNIKYLSNLENVFLNTEYAIAYSLESNTEQFKLVVNDLNSLDDEIYPCRAITASCTKGTIFVDGYFVQAHDEHIVCDVIHKRMIKNSDAEDDIEFVNEVYLHCWYKDKNEEKLRAFKYSYDAVEYNIGFRIDRSIVTSKTDDNLCDPALGSYNYKAAGAHRMKIDPRLACFFNAYPKNEMICEDGDQSKVNVNNKYEFENKFDAGYGKPEDYTSFVTGIVIKNGKLIQQQNTGTNSTFDDYLAQRTFEESGNYTVNPWYVRIEDVDTNPFSVEATYNVCVEPGLGYVYGKRVQTVAERILTNTKAMDYVDIGEVTNVVDIDCLYTYGDTDSNGTLKANNINFFNMYEQVRLIRANGTEILSSNRTVNDKIWKNDSIIGYIRGSNGNYTKLTDLYGELKPLETTIDNINAVYEYPTVLMSEKNAPSGFVVYGNLLDNVKEQKYEYKPLVYVDVLSVNDEGVTYNAGTGEYTIPVNLNTNNFSSGNGDATNYGYILNTKVMNRQVTNNVTYYTYNSNIFKINKVSGDYTAFNIIIKRNTFADSPVSYKMENGVKRNIISVVIPFKHTSSNFKNGAEENITVYFAMDTTNTAESDNNIVVNLQNNLFENPDILESDYDVNSLLCIGPNSRIRIFGDGASASFINVNNLETNANGSKTDSDSSLFFDTMNDLVFTDGGYADVPNVQIYGNVARYRMDYYKTAAEGSEQAIFSSSTSLTYTRTKSKIYTITNLENQTNGYNYPSNYLTFKDSSGTYTRMYVNEIVASNPDDCVISNATIRVYKNSKNEIHKAIVLSGELNVNNIGSLDVTTTESSLPKNLVGTITSGRISLPKSEILGTIFNTIFYSIFPSVVMFNSTPNISGIEKSVIDEMNKVSDDRNRCYITGIYNRAGDYLITLANVDTNVFKQAVRFETLDGKGSIDIKQVNGAAVLNGRELPLIVHTGYENVIPYGVDFKYDDDGEYSWNYSDGVSNGVLKDGIGYSYTETFMGTATTTSKTIKITLTNGVTVSDDDKIIYAYRRISGKNSDNSFKMLDTSKMYLPKDTDGSANRNSSNEITVSYTETANDMFETGYDYYFCISVHLNQIKPRMKTIVYGEDESDKKNKLVVSYTKVDSSQDLSKYDFILSCDTNNTIVYNIQADRNAVIEDNSIRASIVDGISASSISLKFYSSDDSNKYDIITYKKSTDSTKKDEVTVQQYSEKTNTSQTINISSKNDAYTELANMMYDFITESFDDGQKSNMYDYVRFERSSEKMGKIINQYYLIKDRVAPSKVELSINISYWQHESLTTTSTYLSPYTVVSYIGMGTDKDNVNDNICKTTNLFEYDSAYANIPTIKFGNLSYNLRDCIDFRYDATDMTSDTKTNAGSSESINVGMTNYFHRPVPNTYVTYNIKKFIPRIDIVYVNKNGEFGITQGVSSETPVKPRIADESMPLYYIYNMPFAKTVDEIEYEYINNQRHTMAEINDLENRVSNIENTMAYTMLEKSSIAESVYDKLGNLRYKTGIYTDSFDDYEGCDMEDEEWSASIDAYDCSIRPMFVIGERRFIPYNANTTDISNISQLRNDRRILIDGVKKDVLNIYLNEINIKNDSAVEKGEFEPENCLVTLHDEVNTIYDKLYASTSFSDTYRIQNNELVWNAYLELSVTSLPWYDFDSENSVEKEHLAYRMWDTRDENGNFYEDTENNNINNTNNTYAYTGSWSSDKGELVLSTTTHYAPEVTVNFRMYGARKNTLYTIRMDNFVIDSIFVNSNTTTNTFISSSFTIPKDKITTGTKLITIESEDETVFAYAYITICDLDGYIKENKYVRNTETSLSNFVTMEERDINSGIKSSNKKIGRAVKTLTRVAQTINVYDGITLESIDLYFSKKPVKKSENTGYDSCVKLYIVECDNGIPSNRVVPFSSTYVVDENVKVCDISSIIPGKTTTYPRQSKSDDQNDKRTRFTFEKPIYLSPDIEYAFVVETGSPEYEIYISSVGELDITKNTVVSKDSYTGKMFVSAAGGNRWEQVNGGNSDISFDLNLYAYIENDMKDCWMFVKPKPDDDKTKDDRKIDDEGYDAFTVRINDFVPFGTSIEYFYKLSDTSTSEMIPFINGTTITLPERRIEPPVIIARMKTSKKSVSPFIDFGLSDVLLIQNDCEKPDGDDYYKTGTYVSQNINVSQESNNVRVILEAALPKKSHIKVFYKSSETTAYAISYVNESNSTSNFTNHNIEINDAYNVFTVKEGGKNFYFENPQKNIVNNSVYVVGNNDNNIFIENISTNANFPDDKSKTEGSLEYLRYLVKSSDIKGCEMGFTAYSYENIITTTSNPKFNEFADLDNLIVYHNNSLWRKSTQAEMMEKGLYSQTNMIKSGYLAVEPSTISPLWVYIPVIVTTGLANQQIYECWKPMKDITFTADTAMNQFQQSTVVKNLTDVTQEEFTDYKFEGEYESYNESFRNFAIKIEMYSKNTVDVPKVRNIRAIALV